MENLLIIIGTIFWAFWFFKKDQEDFHPKDFQEFFTYVSRTGLIGLGAGIAGIAKDFSPLVGVVAIVFLIGGGMAACTLKHPEKDKFVLDISLFVNKIVMPSSATLSATGVLKMLGEGKWIGALLFFAIGASFLKLCWVKRKIVPLTKTRLEIPSPLEEAVEAQYSLAGEVGEEVNNFFLQLPKSSLEELEAIAEELRGQLKNRELSLPVQGKNFLKLQLLQRELERRKQLPPNQ